MSKLDEIYIRCDISNNRTDDPLSLDGFKQEIKALLLDLIGEDGDVPEGENLSWSTMRYQAAQLGINSLREELRAKVKAL